MGTLEHFLPDELKKRAFVCGNELVLPYAEALSAIAVATKHQVAVLGLDGFEVRKDGLLTVNMVDPSRYIPFAGDWEAYVSTMNAEAERWLKEHRLGENHGYILTSASENELASAKSRIDKS